MNYLTLEEFKELGFKEISNFEELRVNAELSVDLFTNYFYQNNNLEEDYPVRKKAVKRAVAFQIYYMDNSGVFTAEDKKTLGSISIGRTTINYGNSNSKINEGAQYNLSQDALNLLRSVGFGYRGVLYDR
ncbi:hypothetical protein [Gemella sp. Musashino-2025]